MSNYDTVLETITERTFTAMYAFWSALLTAHTVLLSVAVALPAIFIKTELWKFKLVGGAAIFSIFLILLNLAITRIQYKFIGRRLVGYQAEFSKEQCSGDMTRTYRYHKLIHYMEIISAFSLIAEVILLFLISY